MTDQLEAATTQWTDWLRRWDSQQQAYIEERERCFDVLLDFVQELVGPEFTAVDVAAGPGALSGRLLTRFPRATCLAVDADPVLLELGQRALGDCGGRLDWLQADLRDPAWGAGLGSGTVDLVVSSTATHWLAPHHLAALYREVGRLLRPGGVLLNADQLTFARALPRVRAAAGSLDLRRQERALAAGADCWDSWWDGLADEPAMREAFAERDRVFPPEPRSEDQPIASSDFHHAALAEAGFTEVAVVWQDLDHRVLLGLRG